MRIILLTKKCRYADIILSELKQKNIKIEAVVIEKPKYGDVAVKARKILKKYGFADLLKAVIRRTANKFNSRKNRWINDRYYYNYTDNVSVVENFNGIESEKMLEGLRPDIIILAGTRIIKPNIIKIPSVGIINAHPGLLPKYRGVDVIPWAILNGDEPGVTLHFVDKGVDTGRIIQKQKIQIFKGDTINKLRKRAEIISAKMISECLLRNADGHKITSEENKIEFGKQYYKMNSETLKDAEKKLAGLIAKKQS